MDLCSPTRRELAALSNPTGLITDDGVAIDRQLQVIVCGIAASGHPRGSRAHLATASDGYGELGNAFFGSRRAASVSRDTGAFIGTALNVGRLTVS